MYDMDERDKMVLDAVREGTKQIENYDEINEILRIIDDIEEPLYLQHITTSAN